MGRFERGAPFTIAAIIIILFEYVYRNPFPIVWVGIAGAVAISAVLYGSLRREYPGILQAARFIIPPAFLYWSGLGFSLFLASGIWRHILALAVAAFAALYFEGIRDARGAKDAQSGSYLENLSAYALTLTVFLGSTVMLGFHTMLGWGMTALLGIFFIFLAGVQYSFFAASGFSASQLRLPAFVLSLIFIEFFFVLGRLPFHFMVAGGAITVLWYMATAIVRANMLTLLTKKMVVRHLILGGFLLLVLFATARWV